MVKIKPKRQFNVEFISRSLDMVFSRNQLIRLMKSPIHSNESRIEGSSNGYYASLRDKSGIKSNESSEAIFIIQFRNLNDEQ